MTAGLLGCSGAAQAAGCADLFKFEPEGRLAVADVARLGKMVSIEGAGDRSIIAWTFEPADRPAKGAWRGLVVVAATGSDLGTPVAGGVLWTSSEASFGTMPAVLSRTRDGVKLVVAPRTRMSGCPRGFVAFLGDDGMFEAGGAKLGALRW
ncbi:hypothetical protein [Phenylobacterium sp.]|jgi:hypothetical protein|uniref:hypothetical protein n=1 Tax=Phenylobacterium sp. TaxID=1871053 RepID=UPI002F3E79CB